MKYIQIPPVSKNNLELSVMVDFEFYNFLQVEYIQIPPVSKIDLKLSVMVDFEFYNFWQVT